MTGNEARRIVNAPPIEDPEFEMDAPLFLGTTNPNGPVGDEPISAEQSSDSAAGNDTGEAQQATGMADDAREGSRATPDQTKKPKPKNEVAQKGGKRFRGARRLLDATQSRAIDAHATHLEKQLLAARAAFEADFWRRAKTLKAASAKAISAAQVAALERVILDLDDGAYADAIYDSAELLAEIGWANGKAILDLTTGFDVLPTATLDRLYEAAGAYSSKVNLEEKEALRLTLADAFERGLSTAQTADALKETFAEGFHSVQDGEIVRRLPTDSWATTVERTELSAAANAGSFDLYQAAGVKQAQWVCANSDSSCDECIEADGQVVDIGDEFPGVEVDSPPAHPRCCCTTSPSDSDLGDFRTGGEEQSSWAARGGRTAEEWERDFGHKHVLDDGDDE